MPVLEIAPPVTASPCAPVAAFSSFQVTPPPAVTRPAVGIDRDRLHLGQVDHHAAVGDGAAGDVVPAAADRDVEPGVARQRERGDDVVRGAAADDQRRAPVDQPVVDRARLVVARVLRPEDAVAEVADAAFVKGCAHGECLSVGAGRLSTET